MVDKLATINECLALTHNNPVNVEDDGSDEWLVGSAAYETALRYMLGDHEWKFATEIATLNRVGDSPDDRYLNAYAKPQNTLGLVWVRVAGHTLEWVIVGNKICVGRTGGPNVNGPVTAKVVLAPDASAFPPGFLQALNTFTISGLYRGLNEDIGAADRTWQAGEAFLAKAKTRTDREQKPRPARSSRMLARRRGFVGGLGR
ncbi:hypothetical protein [Afipia carboxidovorans]|uniref:hypothetical protein n=1 Tax=Afipia carboxidovorans TaxID=40137 RepID=UPI003086E7CC|nr:hypothetical protein CRBSH125_06040 [Afipia carboxidovorans]